jgi:hypothetical protein
MLSRFIQKARRAARKPPLYVAQRLLAEASAASERWRAPMRARRTGARSLCAHFGVRSIDELWTLLARGNPLPEPRTDRAALERFCPGEPERIFAAAELACAHRVQFLGSAPHALGERIDWHADFKTGRRWPPQYFRDIEYANLGQPSDVKVPWELSRMQWLVPLGQAYALSGEERFAEAARAVIAAWIAENPYACSVNWACTMEAAMRVFTLAWLQRVFASAAAWRGGPFREAFLVSLWLHVDFTRRFIERSDVNGNHFTADAAALVVGGRLLEASAEGRRWRDLGRTELEREIVLQVFADGIDYEASVPYHRLVLELLFTAAFALREGGGFSDAFRRRLGAMARFCAAYTRADGSSPLWGDADDARVLPFGGQALGDHRYLVGLVGLLLGDAELTALDSGSRAEAFWWFGAEAAERLGTGTGTPVHPVSQAFPDGGAYIMRRARDHVFIDCGPVGLAGRGGHGHNDALSLEAMLEGVLLIADSGSFVYTADAAARNRFRGTAMHSTPQVDGVEMNSFIAPDNLWQLSDEARACATEWSTDARRDTWSGRHQGFRKLADPVDVERRIVLEHDTHALSITDTVRGAGRHSVVIPLQLAPGVEYRAASAAGGVLAAAGRRFRLEWSSDVPWSFAPGRSEISPSYGVAIAVNRLEWRRDGELPCSLTVRIEPAA